MRLRNGGGVTVIRESGSMSGISVVGDGKGPFSCWEVGEAGVRCEFGITVICEDSRRVLKQFRGMC